MKVQFSDDLLLNNYEVISENVDYGNTIDTFVANKHRKINLK